jgi:hypothetical protein
MFGRTIRIFKPKIYHHITKDPIYTAMIYVDVILLQSGGPGWDVPKGRKDGRISKASETIQLPSPSFNISQLQKSFSQRGLSMEDLVALSGKKISSPKLHHLLKTI